MLINPHEASKEGVFPPKAACLIDCSVQQRHIHHTHTILVKCLTTQIETAFGLAFGYYSCLGWTDSDQLPDGTDRKGTTCVNLPLLPLPRYWLLRPLA